MQRTRIVKGDLWGLGDDDFPKRVRGAGWQGSWRDGVLRVHKRTKTQRRWRATKWETERAFAADPRFPSFVILEERKPSRTAQGRGGDTEQTASHTRGHQQIEKERRHRGDAEQLDASRHQEVRLARREAGPVGRVKVVLHSCAVHSSLTRGGSVDVVRWDASGSYSAGALRIPAWPEGGASMWSDGARPGIDEVVVGEGGCERKQLKEQ